jgi:putative RNA 2'-phosphotransferase
MDEKRRIRVSKFVSKHLRHAPAAIGLVLEPGGWVLIDTLIANSAQAGFNFTREELEDVVRSCEKQRFAISEAGDRIRANQGHSAEVELTFASAQPAGELFHGTAERNVAAILRDGLLKMARHHVHLSADRATALKVGVRHGMPVVFAVDALRMLADGHAFYRSANDVWLVDSVPPEYLRIQTLED